MQTSQEMDLLRPSQNHSNIERVEVGLQSPYDKDQIELARTGKKQVFKVRLGPKHIQITNHERFFVKTAVVEKFCLHVDAGV